MTDQWHNALHTKVAITGRTYTLLNKFDKKIKMKVSFEVSVAD